MNPAALTEEQLTKIIGRTAEEVRTFVRAGMPCRQKAAHPLTPKGLHHVKARKCVKAKKSRRVSLPFADSLFVTGRCASDGSIRWTKTENRWSMRKASWSPTNAATGTRSKQSCRMPGKKTGSRLRDFWWGLWLSGVASLQKYPATIREALPSIALKTDRCTI